MSHKHENLIRAIFHDPISGNIQFREVESLLRHLGAEVESLSGTRIRVSTLLVRLLSFCLRNTR